LIALIANARRSTRDLSSKPRGSPWKKSPVPSTSAVYGPSPSCKVRDGVGLFRKDQFCFKRIRELQRSSLSPQLRRSQSRDESERRYPLEIEPFPRPGPSTERVSSSRCHKTPPRALFARRGNCCQRTALSRGE